jgi:uncharacterized protein involved in exopolysaccharide biosynthesis
VKALIRDELVRIQTGIEAEYNAARANATSLEHQIDQLKGQSKVTSQKLVPLRQLEREVEVLRASYDRFAKIKDTLTQQESESPPARIVAVARPPLTRPVRAALLSGFSHSAAVCFSASHWRC